MQLADVAAECPIPGPNGYWQLAQVPLIAVRSVTLTTVIAPAGRGSGECAVSGTRYKGGCADSFAREAIALYIECRDSGPGPGK